MTKLFIMFVCAAIGTATGFCVMNGYKRKKAYFDGVCAMIAELKRNISYKRESAASILAGFKTDSAPLKKNIDEYIAYTAAKDAELDISRGPLSPDAHRKVTELFLSLGASDGAAQMSELDAHERTFLALRAEADKNCREYGALSVKLGFLFGVGVGVLFL